MLPIAAISLDGQVQSRSSSRVRPPGSSAGAVVLGSQTALTGSGRPWTIPQREHGYPAAELPETAVGQRRPESLPSFAPADRRWRRRIGSVSGSCGVRAVLAARAARRAALKPYRKFSQIPERVPPGAPGWCLAVLMLRWAGCPVPGERRRSSGRGKRELLCLYRPSRVTDVR